MRRAIWIPLAVTAGVTLAVGMATARPSYPTKITYDGSIALSRGQFLLTGHVASPHYFCRLGRAVKLKAHYPDGKTKLLDFGLTSMNGAWATKADLTGADRLKAKVQRASFISLRSPGRQTHRTVCQADAIVFSVPHP